MRKVRTDRPFMRAPSPSRRPSDFTAATNGPPVLYQRPESKLAHFPESSQGHARTYGCLDKYGLLIGHVRTCVTNAGPQRRATRPLKYSSVFEKETASCTIDAKTRKHRMENDRDRRAGKSTSATHRYHSSSGQLSRLQSASFGKPKAMSSVTKLPFGDFTISPQF